MIVETSGGQSEDWNNRRYKPEDIWAFAPVKAKADLPAIGDEHPVDFFINRQLNARQLQPAPPAEASTLIRRNLRSDRPASQTE